MKDLLEEPVIAWWRNHGLRKKKHIISKVKSRSKKKSHKYGIEISKTVSHALEIDRNTGTDIWKKALQKEMKNVRVALVSNTRDTYSRFFMSLGFIKKHLINLFWVCRALIGNACLVRSSMTSRKFGLVSVSNSSAFRLKAVRALPSRSLRVSVYLLGPSVAPWPLIAFSTFLLHFRNSSGVPLLK